MPTILDFASREFEKGVAYLEIAKAGGKLSIAELTTLAKIVNNSTVGASKLLHFASPSAYAILDSRVASIFARESKAAIELPSSISHTTTACGSCRIHERPLKSQER